MIKILKISLVFVFAMSLFVACGVVEEEAFVDEDVFVVKEGPIVEKPVVEKLRARSAVESEVRQELAPVSEVVVVEPVVVFEDNVDEVRGVDERDVVEVELEAVVDDDIVEVEVAPEFELDSEPVLFESKYKMHKGIMSTVFWFGEEGSFDEENYNAGISNVCSAWECPYADSSNPYYVAIPYDDLYYDEGADDTLRRADASGIPWYNYGKASTGPYYSFVKNRWVEVRLGEKVCYGQVEDVGPFVEDDFGYVFGGADVPKNLVNSGVGLDLSPEMANCLGHNRMERVDWSFVDYSDVPNGDWKVRVETENPNWDK